MTTTHHNDKIEQTYGKSTVRAFAQVCGRDWTYYVQDAEINIGREQAQENDAESPKVHIDLGHSKVVSRTHAVVSYGPDDQEWHVKVHGRNGIKVDDEDLRKGESRVIHCGTVISVAGTEMLFQIAEENTRIHQKYKDRVVRYEEEVDDGVLRDGPSSGHPPPYYSTSRQPYSGGAPTSPYPPVAPDYIGQSNFAQNSQHLARPITPEVSPSKQAGGGSTKKRSPPNRRGINGMMMESTEQIDYALESSKAIKPGCSYAAMITWAILSTPDQTLSLAGIYVWIKAHYAYYRNAQTGWQVHETFNSLQWAITLTSHRIRSDIIFH